MPVPGRDYEATTERAVGRDPGALGTDDGDVAGLFPNAPADSLSIQRTDVPTVPAHKRDIDGNVAEDLR